MKKLVTVLTLAIAAFVGTANDSEAISLRFKFKVFSSGLSIYACNAGIRHTSDTKKVCYFEGTNTACTQNDCKDKSICNTQCVCSGSYGSSRVDFMHGTVQPWTDHKAVGDNIKTSVGASSFSKKSPTDGTFATLVDNASSWNDRISQLSFELGSELYGSEYFVDICFRGSQTETFLDNISLDHRLTAQSSDTDFLANSVNPGDNTREGLTVPGLVDGMTYSDLAGLKVKAYYTCDVQGVGTYKYAHNGSSPTNGTYNTTLNEANFNFDGSGYPVSGGDEFGTSGSFVPLAGNGVDLLNTWITQGSHSPRFCKIRYVYSETNNQVSLPNLRKWQRHGAEVCTYTTIEDPPTNE